VTICNLTPFTFSKFLSLKVPRTYRLELCTKHRVFILCYVVHPLWSWRCSSLMVLLPHCDLFPVTSVGYCWVPANLPCWVLVPCKSSSSSHRRSNGNSGSHSGSRVGRGVAHTPKKFLAVSKEGFCSCPECCVAQLLLTGPTAFLSRLPAEHVCCLGTDLHHVFLVQKVSAIPAPLGKPGLARLSIFCSFTCFRCRHSSVYRCLRAWNESFWGLQFPLSFRLIGAAEFGTVSKLPS
jgi:hypothetical protein